MMLSLWIVAACMITASCIGDVDFSLEVTCPDSLELTAVYLGSGIVSAVQWYYSGQTASNLLILSSTCEVAGSVPGGYPDIARMNFTCNVTSGIYTLTLSNLNGNEFEKSWGATFTLSVGNSPDVNESSVSQCPTETTTSTKPLTVSTTPTTTSTTPTTTSTTPTTPTTTSTSPTAASTIPTTTRTTSSSSTTPTTRSTIITTRAQASTTAVNDGTDSKLTVIIASSVVGAIFIIGIAIAALILCHRQLNNRKHTSRKQLHRNNDYHKRYQTSNSTYQQNDDYYLYNAKAFRNKVKEDPLNRVSNERKFNMNIDNRPSRYDYYSPHYTIGFVHPSVTRGYHFMSGYTSDIRNPRYPKRSSHSGYEMKNFSNNLNKTFCY